MRERPMDLRLALLGCGNLGRAFIALVATKDAELRDRYGLHLRFSGGLTRSAGGWQAASGFDAATLAAAGWPEGDRPAGSQPFTGDGQAFAATCPAAVVVEPTTLQPLTGQPAIGHVRAALAAGRHVLPAHKGAMTHDYSGLPAL